MTQADPYWALVELAERERAIILDGRHDELPVVDAERTAILAALPARPPASARPALERLSALQEATTAALAAALADVRRQLGGMNDRHRAVRAYSGV